MEKLQASKAIKVVDVKTTLSPYLCKYLFMGSLTLVIG